MLPEPGQPFWVANRSIETRQQHSIFRAVDTPLADKCVIMRAFPRRPSAAAQIQEPAKNSNRMAQG